MGRCVWTGDKTLTRRRQIVAVNCYPPGGQIDRLGYRSKQSLLQWDIILFRPSIPVAMFGYADTYRGKLSLSDYHTVDVRESVAHWRAELVDAQRAGKTVIVILDRPQEFFYDTGKREHSGTGRNQKTTRIVHEMSSYDALPFTLTTRHSEGTEMALTPDGAFLADLWRVFSEQTNHHVTLERYPGREIVTTRAGGKVLGTSVRSEASSGTVLLLPPFFDWDDEWLLDEDESAESDFEQDEDEEDKDDEDDENVEWSDYGLAFGAKLINALVEIDKYLRGSSEATPAPDWANGPQYQLPAERRVREEILRIDEQLDMLRSKRTALQNRLTEETDLRLLLYATGTPLERAIGKSLELLGFRAEPYRNEDSEFDVVFESAEGRLLGEAEGKDNKAINIEKVRQLLTNIQEDFARDEVDDPAKGVLFGNASRLTPPSERGDHFTEKALKSAKQNALALVRTIDLFEPAKYLSDNNDPEYARTCRETILTTSGDVAVFPPSPPVDDAPQEVSSVDRT